MLMVDPVSCDGHGVCAELLPERIRRDPWGYPIVSSEPLGAAHLEHARRAVASCPRLALHLVNQAGPGQRAEPRRWGRP